MKNIYLIPFISLFVVNGALAKKEDSLVKAEESEVAVSSGILLDSGFSGRDWEKFITDGGDPFGRDNHFFKLKISNKNSNFVRTMPMIPAGKLAVSPHSKYIAILSVNYPTDGVVIVSADGKVILKEFGICFNKETCTVVSDSLAVWYETYEVVISFSSKEDGDDCLLTIQANDENNLSPKIFFDVCSKTSKNYVRRAEIKD